MRRVSLLVGRDTEQKNSQSQSFTNKDQLAAGPLFFCELGAILAEDYQLVKQVSVSGYTGPQFSFATRISYSVLLPAY